ncbi:MAG: hypothetical protein KAI55_03885, partial [Candidatus Aenigmarchaeota archaeon]|nr:hypothetical protein [Candidatus Aenigmarchaeota archaeon]
MLFEHIKTDIDKIDKVLDGGIVKKSSVLFLGSKNSKKETILMELLKNRIKNKDALLYITTNKRPDVISTIFANNKIDISDYEKKGMFKWIDAYSKSIGENTTNSEKLMNVFNPQSLNELNVAINKFNKELGNKNPEIIDIYDNISISFIQQDLVLTKQFFHHIIGNAKKNATLFLLMDKDSHDKETIAIISLFCDYVFDFEKESQNNKDAIKIKIYNAFTNEE